MSQAFQCDLCGICVSSQALAESKRKVARENTIVSGTQTDISITIEVHKSNTCDTCWLIVMQKAKAWINANV